VYKRQYACMTGQQMMDCLVEAKKPL